MLHGATRSAAAESPVTLHTLSQLKLPSSQSPQKQRFSHLPPTQGHNPFRPPLPSPVAIRGLSLRCPFQTQKQIDRCKTRYTESNGPTCVGFGHKSPAVICVDFRSKELHPPETSTVHDKLYNIHNKPSKRFRTFCTI